MADDLQKDVARHWDKYISGNPGERARWWQSNKVITYINNTVCGEPVGGLNEGAIRLLRSKSDGRKFKRALSIGCGKAFKELNLVKRGIVDHFHLFEISAESCKLALERFNAAGLGNNVTVINADFFKARNLVKYDLVYWDNSLHHMLDCHDAISRTYDSLKVGGFFFVNDFVGKTRFQWSDKELECVNMFRNSLPDHVFRHNDEWAYPKEVRRPTIQHMIKVDPSEAADSDSIIPSLKSVLDNPAIIPTGGSIYHLGLNDILANIGENSPILSHALKIDSRIADEGMYQYAVCIAQK